MKAPLKNFLRTTSVTEVTTTFLALISTLNNVVFQLQNLSTEVTWEHFSHYDMQIYLKENIYSH